MIKINLLPQKKDNRKTALIKQGTTAFFSLLVVLMVLFVCAANIKGKVKALDKKNATIKSELAELEENRKKIEELKASEIVFQKKIDVIKKLEQRKTGPVKMLDEIASIIPEKMWLNELKNQRSLLSLDGVAIDNETIALFMTSLENSDQFNNVELKVAQEIKVEDFMLKKFSLNCVVKAMEEIEKKTSEQATPKTK